MALARARAFQQQQDAIDQQNRRIEKLFQLKILHPGDAVNFPKNGDSVCL